MRYQRGLCLGKTARPPAPCGFLKDLAHIFIATQSQQRPHADSSIEPRDIRVEFGYETRSHNVSPMPLVFPVRISRLEDLHQGQFAILPPYTPECLADSFIANTSGCPQNTVTGLCLKILPQTCTIAMHHTKDMPPVPKTSSQFSLSLLVCWTHQHRRQPIHRHLRPRLSRNILPGEF